MLAKIFNFFILYLLVLIVLYLLGTFLTWQPNPLKWWFFEEDAFLGRTMLFFISLLTILIKKEIKFKILTEKD